MEFAAAITGNSNLRGALDELRAQLGARMATQAVHLACVFASAHFEDELEALGAEVSALFPHAATLGCTAEGTIGAGQELERVPSIALLAATLPDVAVRPFHLSQSDLEHAGRPADWAELLGIRPDQAPVLIALGDPFSFHIQHFLEQMNEHYPGAPVFGGMASGGHRNRQNGLLLNGLVHHQGLVGVALSGNLAVRGVVSQGCRPIGKPLVVTRGGDDVIRELGGRPALTVLKELVSALDPTDERLAREGGALFVGRVINEYQETFKRGDFLIHNLIGADPNNGALAIHGLVRVGTTVQFHVRDARSADEDLRELLGNVDPRGATRPAGALIFSCNGRGTRMWPEPGHDISVLSDICENVPAAGFFCAGELGPIGQRNFIHGFTASIALFSPAK